MAILQYWCPKHHTTKRLTRRDKEIFWMDDIVTGKKIYKIQFKHVTPICQVCRQDMVRLHGKMPKKTKKKGRK